MSILSLLRNSAAFSELDDTEMSELAEVASLRSIRKGGLLFLEDDHATGFFVLVSGAVRIYKSAPDGREYTLHRIRPGQMFAEAAIFKGGKYPASCIAVDDSEVAFFPKEAFLSLLKKYPQIALKIMSGLSAWLREFTIKLEALSLKDVPSRLAQYLLQQAEKHNHGRFELHSSKTELAYELGTVIETLSRSLRKLKDSSIIREDGKFIEIIDEDRLKILASGEKA